MFNKPYTINDPSQIISPSMVLFEEIMRCNLNQMITIAGDVTRLRPHCKTHKMSNVAQIELQQGITKHKAATFAEAEMLADAGIKDIFLAYSLVGPNILRAVQFLQKYPNVLFSVTADHPVPIVMLGTAMSAANVSINVLLDLDTGQHRTGILAGQKAFQIYKQISETEGLIAGGIHLYDGQNHQTNLHERETAVQQCWKQATDLRDQLVTAGFTVPRIVAGGTGSFPCYAKFDDPTLELSPGTCLLHDAGYGAMYPDLDFTPAALLLTRVISCPAADCITLDLGYKAVASDPPAGNRLYFPMLPDAKEVLQNEEHLVLQTPRANEFEPGDILLAIPRHICPTSALHKEVTVIRNGDITETWQVTARDRKLTI
ncbi:Type III PLP / low-specificity D-threonine aldolase [hydrothermal vent metagenome]|uniref:Type III PLP / low-specificity D-threonine aldolase n=1 Tax=hydrothermal vent metagenome TaxID=652676 RepID=A0A3B1DFD2_9ZZZZ